VAVVRKPTLAVFRSAKFTDEPDHQYDDGGDPQQVQKATGCRKSNLQDNPEDQKDNSETSNGIHAEWIEYHISSGGIAEGVE